jgi:hypothetical protein
MHILRVTGAGEARDQTSPRLATRCSLTELYLGRASTGIHTSVPRRSRLCGYIGWYSTVFLYICTCEFNPNPYRININHTNPYKFMQIHINRAAVDLMHILRVTGGGEARDQTSPRPATRCSLAELLLEMASTGIHTSVPRRSRLCGYIGWYSTVFFVYMYM